MPEPLLFIALLAFPFVAALVLRMVNLKRVRRSRQVLAFYLSPVFAIVIIVACSFSYPHIPLTEYLPFFDGSVEIVDAHTWNIIALLVFFIAKAVCLLAAHLSKSNASVETMGSAWYELDEETGLWFLKERHLGLRRLFGALSWGCALACGIALVFDAYAGTESSTWALSFPIMLVAVVTECYNYLAGFTKPEWQREVQGENALSTRVGAYHKLRQVYESLFGSALLSTCTGIGHGGVVGATQKVKELLESDDEQDRRLGNYFNVLEKSNGLFNVDFIDGASLLLHGKNVVFFDPHYRDLGEYLLLPMVDALVNARKCLIVVGRNAAVEDVRDWLGEVLCGYSRTSGLWRIEQLDEKVPDCEVGILSFSRLYSPEVLSANDTFFDEVGLVLLVEPSRMLATSQIGLGIVAERLGGDMQPIYCVMDLDCNGLVDVLSHVLKVNITHAYAAPSTQALYTAMNWSAAGDYIRQQLFGKQTSYLGNGTELAAVALKNQVPSVLWYSEEKAPVRDLRWIVGQCYPQICRYANLPPSQQSIDDKFGFRSVLWGTPIEDEAFVIAEDECSNAFATMRAYLSRGKSQSFVNVISENYLLRDYLCGNSQMFSNDARAIPICVPHYAKTERNVLYGLILLMASGSVPESRIANELNLLQHNGEEVHVALLSLLGKYTGIGEPVFSIVNDYAGDGGEEQENQYFIDSVTFRRYFSETLRNAYFVVEEEELESQYIDARLFGHITQTVMPGQYMTYAGKHYRVHSVSPELGCVLRRAADEYHARHYYRQLRTYVFEGQVELVASRRIMDLGISLIRCGYSVSSTGYLDMHDLHDLRTAKLVDLSEDPGVGVYSRSYREKTIIKLDLPETDERMRFTICLLLGEISRTLFPYAWPYLAFLSSRPADIGGMLDNFVYRIEGDFDAESIYIVEDSDMDIGLIEAVDDNLMRLFEIMADFLNWHFEKMHEPAHDDPIVEAVIVPEGKRPTTPTNPFSKLARRLTSFINRRRDKDDESKPASDETSSSSAEGSVSSEATGDSSDAQMGVSALEADEVAVAQDGTSDAESCADVASLGDGAAVVVERPEHDEASTEDAGAFIGLEEDVSAPGGADSSSDVPEASQADPSNSEELLIPPEEKLVVEGYRGSDEDVDFDVLAPIELMEEYRIRPSRYQRDCFLKFGFEDIDERLSIEDVGTYLTVRGWADNDLARARKRDELDLKLLDMKAENTCDFCGMPLSGVSYDALSDGRVRCNECTASAINDVEEFKELLRTAELMLRDAFGVTLPVSLDVSIADARTVAKRAHAVFRPSTGVTPRVLGFAQKKGGQYSLVLENGSPRLAAIDTMVHELTHIWQYINWDDTELHRIYGMNREGCTNRACDIVYEGMAMWVANQALYAMGEIHYARIQEHLTAKRTDVYGKGFRLYRDRYGLNRSGSAPANTPFKFFPPLEISDVVAASKALCFEGDDCIC